MTVQEEDAAMVRKTKGKSEYIQNLISREKGHGRGPQGTHETQFGPIICNLPVTLIASGVLWGMVIYCMVVPEQALASLKDAQSAVTDFFTWAYIASNGVWVIYIGAVYYYFGDAKLGKEGDKPIYDDASYFMMVFCAGIAVGLIFYGAAEPMWHYTADSSGATNRYADSGYLNENEIATHAINLTLYHWGIHGWAVYTLTALNIGVLYWKYDLPLTYRTAFFPLFGKATWGWFGDIIDSFTITGVIAGVCTSLGLGASQIVSGMQHPNLAWLSPECSKTVETNCLSNPQVVNVRCITIAVITMLATLSVLSGLDAGVKLLSQVAFTMGMLCLTLIFILDNPWYLLNVMTQSIGVYVQWFMQLGWYTDAFAQLKWGDGKAWSNTSSTGVHDLDEPYRGNQGANEGWMDWWTIFYWGWWIAWSPFVGIFLARISGGRTVKEVINYTLTVPFFYSMIWFCSFGGAAIKMHRRAELLQAAGSQLYGNPNQFLLTADTRTNCYVVPKELLCPAPGGLDLSVADCKRIAPYSNGSYVGNQLLSPVCTFDTGNSMFITFDLLGQYQPIGAFLCGFTIFTLAIYFITSSDSGSMVVDYMSCNGKEAHWSQRVYWSWTEGGVAIALLMAGGKDALRALQAASIVTGVPFTIFVCLICLSLWRVLKHDFEWVKSRQFEEWQEPLYGGACDVLEWIFSGGVARLPALKHIGNWLLCLVVPPFQIWKILKESPAEKGAQAIWLIPSIAALTWFGFVLCMCLSVVHYAIGGIGFFCYCVFVTLTTGLRVQHRELYRIDGSGAEDAVVSFFLYHQVLWQLLEQVQTVRTPVPPVSESKHDIELSAPQAEQGQTDNPHAPVKLGSPTEENDPTLREEVAKLRQDVEPVTTGKL